MRPMDVHIRPDHPLNHLFAELINKHVVRAAGIDDVQISRYIARILTDFTHVDSLYRIRDVQGRRLDEVGEMLMESNPLLQGSSFFREREVRKHVGDYTMFLTGLFPEYVARMPSRTVRVDAFIDYMHAGKESYNVVASFNQFEFRSEAPLYRKLADRFELCVYGLNLVKAELEWNQKAWYRGLRQAAFPV